MGGANGALQMRQLQPTLKASMITAGVDPAFFRDYVQHHYKHDPHLAHAARLAEGQTLFSRDILPDDEFCRTAYYREFCEPQGLCDVVGVMLIRNEELAVSYASYSPTRQRFDRPHRQRLQALVPHLTRVVRLGLQQEHAGSLRNIESVRRSRGPALLCVDRELRVQGTAGDLEGWLVDDQPLLELRHGSLHMTARCRGQLDGAVARALAGLTTSLALEDWARLIVTPGHDDDRPKCHQLVNVLLLPVAKAVVTSPLSALPPSLARVASLMARGAADKDIAVALDISVPSARTYAARVLKRLELRSRRDLMLHAREGWPRRSSANERTGSRA